MSDFYQFVGGPEDNRWYPVPDNLPSTIKFPYRIPFFELGINPSFYPGDPDGIMYSEYQKVYGHYIDETGVERSLRYEFRGIE